MLYREGAKGEMVKKIQMEIGVTPDGHFGPMTKEAVKIWQRKHNLVVDGIVGPKSLDLMGILDTDVQEQFYTTENGLLIQRHFLPQGQYIDGPTNKEYAFLHHTAGWDNPFNCIDSWGRDSRGRVATEFVLGGQRITDNREKYDGKMLQCMPDGAYGWHLGRTGSAYMHSHSVALEICSFGGLKDGKTYVKTEAHPDQICELEEPFMGYSEYHRYSDAQIKQTELWIRYIAERDNIDVREGLVDWVRNKGVEFAFGFNEDAYNGKVKGLLSHTNVYKGKSDVFPQPELIDMLMDI